MNIPFGPDFLKRYHEALERQKRRKMERRARGQIDFSEMTQEQRVEYIKSSPSALKFLEKQGFVLDENDNFVKTEKSNNSKDK